MIRDRTAPVRVLLATIIAVVLITTTLVLVPFAYADPPDPTWLGGLWDNSDFDVIVIAVMSTVAVAAHQAPPALADHVLVVVGTVDDGVVLRRLRDPEFQHQPRSPPVR